MKTILTPGEDPRMIPVANALLREGYALAAAGEAADLALCPPGWKEKALIPVTEKLRPGGLLVAGKISLGLSALCGAGKLRALALLDDPGYRAANALATAEGTLAEAIRLFPRTLAGERVLTLGYGACGGAIARLFRAAGARVSVWSHPKSLARAEEDGFQAARASDLPRFALVINTVPEPDFMPRLIDGLSSEALFLQIASGDPPLAETLAAKGVRCVCLPGLPGKYAPESEARAVLAVLRKHLAAPETKD